MVDNRLELCGELAEKDLPRDTNIGAISLCQVLPAPESRVR